MGCGASTSNTVGSKSPKKISFAVTGMIHFTLAPGAGTQVLNLLLPAERYFRSLAAGKNHAENHARFSMRPYRQYPASLSSSGHLSWRDAATRPCQPASRNI